MTPSIVEAPDREITIELPRFGSCTYRESEVLTFPWGLPGFAADRRFVALSLEGQTGFYWLQSLDDLSVALPVSDPWRLFPDYDPRLPGYAVDSLEIERAEDFVALGVVVIPPGGAGAMTMNLLAPVIVNLRTRLGRQVTLDDRRYSVRTPVPGWPAAPAGACNP